MLDLNQFLGTASPLALSMPGFQPRLGQLVLAEAVTDTFEHGGLLVAEAATGVGKSLAYLVPALLTAGTGPVVVSTGNRSLQEQLVRDDVPRAQAATGRRLHAVVLKGRGNYLCRHRIATAPERLATTPDDVAELARLGEWIDSTPTGQRDDAPRWPSGRVWSALSIGSSRCLGRRCEHIGNCHSESARARAQQADVVIVNHALYMADVAIRRRTGNQVAILPDHDRVVFDEAHLLEDQATRWLGVTLSRDEVGRLAADALDAADRARVVLPEQDVRRLVLHFEHLFNALPGGLKTRLDRTLLGRLPIEHVEGARVALAAIDEALHERSDEADTVAREARIVGGSLEALLAPDTDESVVWTERVRSAPDVQQFLPGTAEAAEPGIDVRLCMAPIDVGASLDRVLWQEIRSAVLVSATLAVGGTLGHISSRLGLHEPRQLVVPTPYDLGRSALLYVTPAGRVPLRDARYAAGDVAAEVAALLDASQGRALILFSSRSQLDAVHATLGPRLPHLVLKQGEASRNELVERFRSDVSSVLFATMSFWQGLDVPGEALSLVVIDRLPFAVPSDPLHEARAERADRLGGSGFREVSLPHAELMLKQGFGRLLRSESDRGVVAVLDDRLVRSAYGTRLRAALGEVPLTREVEDVRAFLSTVAA